MSKVTELVARCARQMGGIDKAEKDPRTTKRQLAFNRGARVAYEEIYRLGQQALAAEQAQPAVQESLRMLAQEIIKPHWPVVRNMEESEARNKEVGRIIAVLLRVSMTAQPEQALESEPGAQNHSIFWNLVRHWRSSEWAIEHVRDVRLPQEQCADELEEAARSVRR